MKLLIVHNRYLSKNVGGEDVVFTNEVNSLRKIIGNANVLTYEVSNDNLSKFKLLFNIFFSFYHYFQIQKVIRHNKIDIVHVHNYFPLLTPSVFRGAKRAGASVVHTLHNFRWWCIAGVLYRDNFGVCERCVKSRFPMYGIRYNCFRDSKIQSFVAQVAFWFYHICDSYRNIDCFFVLSEFQKTKILSFGVDSNKIRLKPNSIKLIKPDLIEKKGFIFVGRLEPSKGFDLLLAAWGKLPPNFELTVIGEGELEIDINQANLNNVNFLGKLPHHEALQKIKESKYLIQTSLLYETFGLTILEAMATGTPVIGFNIGTRSEFIKHGTNGFLTTPSNLVETLVEAESYSNYHLLSKNAFESALRFSDDTIFEKQIGFYEELIRKQV